MTARQRFNGSENQQVHAWILGSTIASLASAVHIIQEAKVPASQIHIVESRKSGEDGLPTTGNATVGYDHQAACMSILYDDCTKDLLSLVPSVTRSDKSLLDDITGEQRVPAARHIMIKGDTKRHTIDTRRIRIGLKTRIKLAIFVSQSEKTLGQHTIRDFFNKRFFKTTFWSIWASVFGFAPWHSAIEFRRSLRNFFHTLSRPCTDSIAFNRCKYNAHEDIILPITRFLQQVGADLKFNSRVMDIKMDSAVGRQRVSTLQLVQNGVEKVVEVGPHDLVIASLGSAISGATSGTDIDPPALELQPAEDYLGENWSLWLGLFSNFGDPYNLCTRVNESRSAYFTITSQRRDLFEEFLKGTANTVASIVFPASNWSLSLFRPHDSTARRGSCGARISWGFASSPEEIGNFVKKPMIHCSGRELLVELLHHLDHFSESVLNDFTTIPCVAPRLGAPLLVRETEDRPEVINKNFSNLAMVGQFVEIPCETSATMDYSVRSAQMAVYRLMGMTQTPRATKNASLWDLLVL